MNFNSNPFSILGLTSLDSKTRIIKVAEEATLFGENETEVMDAKTILTTPSKRIEAEVGWFVGLGKKQIRDIRNECIKSGDALLQRVDLPSIIKANLIADIMNSFTISTPEKNARWALALAVESEEIKSENLMSLINEDRKHSGFPLISAPGVLDEAIRSQRIYYRQSIQSLLDKMLSTDVVKTMTLIVDKATSNGKKHAPLLIDDLISYYEMHSRAFFEVEEENLQVVIEELTSWHILKEEDGVTDTPNKLEIVIENWCRVAKPIQISKSSRGMEDEDSKRVAAMVRHMAISLFNDFNMLNTAMFYSQFIKRHFSDSYEVAQLIDNDIERLNEIKSEWGMY